MFKSYNDDKLCIVRCLNEYIDRSEESRKLLPDSGPLILSYAAPYKPVGVSTIARYVKTFLGQSGVDINVFNAHSTRSASTSKLNNKGLSIKDICKAAGWSRESTFRKYYELPIAENFGEQLLNQCTNKEL